MKLVCYSMTVVFLLASWTGPVGLAAGEPCRKLTAPVEGEAGRYAVAADVYGPLWFADIGCAVYWRSTHFCAMEMTSFDSTAKVKDYFTGAEVNMTKAFFVVEEQGRTRTKAFATRESAEQFAAQTGGAFLDFNQLTR